MEDEERNAKRADLAERRKVIQDLMKEYKEKERETYPERVNGIMRNRTFRIS